MLQRSTAAADPAGSIPSAVHDVLRSPGVPLDSATRTSMEPRFGRDFSQVRVHSDDRAADSASAVGATAYTVGDHIAFQAGRYHPSSVEGKHLLAHELAHVAQNQKSEGAPGAPQTISHPDDHAEREAGTAARQISSGGNAQIGAAPSAVMHRDTGTDVAIGLGIASLAGAVLGGIGVGIAALAGAFRQSSVPDLPRALADRLQPACSADATAATRQSAIDALVAWARGQSSLGIDWTRVEWVHYDDSVGARGSKTDANDTQHIKLSLGPVAFSSVANLYSTFRHELVHTQEHETRPRADIMTRGEGVQEVYAYLWELEHQRQTGLARRENWGLAANGTADTSVGLARVVDGLMRGLGQMAGELSQNPNAVPGPEQLAIERRVACGMIATPREVVTAVFPGAPLERWRQECAHGVNAT
jgi:Domain of unknown function (DUF4157)